MRKDNVMKPQHPERPRRPNHSLLVACGMLALIAAFFLLREHWGHMAGWWPYLLLLGCPLMHVFMHGGHGHAGHHDLPPKPAEVDSTTMGR
jgi:hypothetical protein